MASEISPTVQRALAASMASASRLPSPVLVHAVIDARMASACGNKGQGVSENQTGPHGFYITLCTFYNTPLGHYTDRGPMGFGQYNSQEEYCGLSTASEVFLISLLLVL